MVPMKMMKIITRKARWVCGQRSTVGRSRNQIAASSLNPWAGREVLPYRFFCTTARRASLFLTVRTSSCLPHPLQCVLLLMLASAGISLI
tara:strand:- start:810 stop:1079 length:270 start_codon:yes stop_codon:yes gene_type:complete